MFSCPECDKTFNCPANLASHRRWHKPQTLVSSNELTPKISSCATEKPIANKQPRCSSRSDSRSTNTSSSIISDIIHDYSSVSTSTSSSNVDTRKTDSYMFNGTHKNTPEHILRAMYNGNSPSIFSSPFQPFTNSCMKQPLILRHHVSVPMSISSSFDFRRLQSSCIFCHEQFSELNHLLQHIRKTHAVTSSTNSTNNAVTLDKIVF